MGTVTQKAKSEIRGTNRIGHPTWNSLPLPGKLLLSIQNSARTHTISFPMRV